MTTRTTELSAGILPRVLAQRTMPAATPNNVVSMLCNLYSIEGQPTQVLRLNRGLDLGPAASAIEGVDFDTVTDDGYDTPVDVTPTEAAVALMRMTDQAVEKEVPGFANALELFASNDIDAQLRALNGRAVKEQRMRLEKLEKDCCELLPTAANSAGATNEDMSLETFEDGLLVLETKETPHFDVVSALSPTMISKLRRQIGIVNGGMGGAVWSGDVQSILKANPNTPAGGLQGAVIGVPVYKISQTRVPDVTTGDGTGKCGAIFLRGEADPEVSGNGQYGAIAIVQGRRPTFATSFALRGRALELMLVHIYAAAKRSNDFIAALYAAA